jgi:hypothetical protein
MKIPSCLAIFLALVPSVSLAAQAPSTIAADTTWTAAQGPYEVTGTTTVSEGATLTVEAGTTVVMGKDAGLLVQGQLIARGTQASPVLFVPAQDGDPPVRWGAVTFEPTSIPATFEQVDQYASGSVLEWCVLEGASHAVRLIGASPYIASCTFRGNRTPLSLDVVGGAALLIESGSAPRIRDCRFEDNFADGFNYGGAVYVDSSAPILQDNVFVGNTAIYGGGLCTTLVASPIVGNRFEGNVATGSEDNSKGGGMSLISTISAVLNNTVTKNESGGDGAGIHVCVDCHPHATPFLMDNTVTQNSAATSDPSHAAGGIGAAFLRILTSNNIHGNTRGGEPSEFGWFHPVDEGFPDWVANVSIAGNWWGTADTAAIDAVVANGQPVDGAGSANPHPALSAPVEAPTPRVTLATRRLRYDEEAQEMGVFLTLYNPGAARSFELRILLRYEGGPSFPYILPLGLPEETVEGGTHRFSMPENSVWFSTLAAPSYDPTRRMGGGGSWSAALHDPEDGAIIGVPCSSRFLLNEEVVP